MSKCDECGITPAYEGGVFCTNCKPQTNADRIRSMTDEELANFLIDVASRGGIQTESGIARWTLIDWLKQEVNNDSEQEKQ